MADMMRITTYEYATRSSWNNIQAWRAKYSEAELVEMLHRYSDTQQQAKAYRERAAQTNRLLKEAVMREAAKKGVSVRDFVLGKTGEGTRVNVTTGEVEK